MALAVPARRRGLAPAWRRRGAAAAVLAASLGGSLAALAALGALGALGDAGGSTGLAAGKLRFRAAAPPAAHRGGIIRRSAREIELPATIAAFRFDHDLFMPGYHAVVWRDGRAAGPALLRCEAADAEVLDALEAMGARPGNALGMDSWDQRHDPRSRAPDQTIAGPPVDVLVRLPGKPPLPLADLLVDPGGRGLDLRLGGHRANIPRWHSGCVVCLYSCPGSKVGNARYTVRDYVRGTTRFRARTELLPPDGTAVGVILRLKD